MSVSLRDEDRKAVDLLLDRAATAQDSAATFAPDGGVSTDRIRAAERVLRVLNALPAAEPAPDLVRRTVERLDQELSPVRGHSPFLIDAGRPVA